MNARTRSLPAAAVVLAVALSAGCALTDGLRNKLVPYPGSPAVGKSDPTRFDNTPGTNNTADGQPAPAVPWGDPAAGKPLSDGAVAPGVVKPAGGPVAPPGPLPVTQPAPPGVPPLPPPGSPATPTNPPAGLPPGVWMPPGTPGRFPGGGDPHIRSTPTASGALLNLGPGEVPADRLVVLAREAGTLAAQNELLLSRIKEMEATAASREQALASAVRDIEAATAEAAKARGEALTARADLGAARARLQQLEKEDIETLRAMIAALERLIPPPVRRLP